MSRCLYGFCLLLVMTAANAAPLYSWIGADGQVHYGDQPPQNVHAKLVDSAVGSGAPDGVAGKSGPAASPAAKADECQMQKDKLATYTSASKITETDALGATHDYSPEDRQKLIAVTQDKINKSCN